MAVTYTYKWQRSPDGGITVTDIPGTNGTFTVNPPASVPESYVWQSADLGDVVRLVVIDGDGFVWTSAWFGPGTAVPAPGGGAASEIYWGSYIDGDQTYEVYYPGLRPGGGTWKDAPWDQETWNKFESNAGKTVSVIAFGQPPWWDRASLDLTALNNCWSRGAIPQVSYGLGSATLTDIIAGKYDAQITAWATALKNWGKPLFFRWCWEMNQYGSGWFPWAVPKYYTPAQYVAGWQHMKTIFDSVGATNVTWVWCPNGILADSSKVSLIDDCYPGDTYVDWTAIDQYNSFSPSQSFHTIFDLTYNTLLTKAPTKPVMICETSSRDTSVFASGVKANWISDVLVNQLEANYPAIKAFVWFNWRIFESGTNKDWPIESSSAATKAFHDGIARSYFKPKFSSVPAFGKVPVPV